MVGGRDGAGCPRSRRGDRMVKRCSVENEAKATPSWSGDSTNPNGDRAMALRLAREFAAPVGLLDPSTLIWRARVGLNAEEFPDADAALTAVLASGLLWHGRVSPWRPA